MTTHDEKIANATTTPTPQFASPGAPEFRGPGAQPSATPTNPARPDGTGEFAGGAQDRRADASGAIADRRHTGDVDRGRDARATTSDLRDDAREDVRGDARDDTRRAANGTSATDHSAAEAKSSADKSLFGQDVSGLRTRWNDVQGQFVDDPRACVQKADSLVSEVVQQLTSNFSETRSRLEEQWSRGNEASTEDLRVALTHYREFFQRLLKV